MLHQANARNALVVRLSETQPGDLVIGDHVRSSAAYEPHVVTRINATEYQARCADGALIALVHSYDDPDDLAEFFTGTVRLLHRPAIPMPTGSVEENGVVKNLDPTFCDCGKDDCCPLWTPQWVTFHMQPTADQLAASSAAAAQGWPID